VLGAAIEPTERSVATATLATITTVVDPGHGDVAALWLERCVGAKGRSRNGYADLCRQPRKRFGVIWSWTAGQAWVWCWQGVGHGVDDMPHSGSATGWRCFS
jgi:hypothetical protein